MPKIAPGLLVLVRNEKDWPHWTPEWVRTILVDTNGQIFIPAAFGDSENWVRIMTGYEAEIETIDYCEHLYVPMLLLKKQFPELADACDLIESKIANRQRE